MPGCKLFGGTRFWTILFFLAGFAGTAPNANGGVSITWTDVTSYINGPAVTGNTSGHPQVYTGLHCQVWDSISAQDFYQFTLSSDASVTIQTCSGAGWDTALYFYTDGMVPIACNEDYCGTESYLSAGVTAGTYRLILTGYNGSAGAYSLWITTDAPVATPTPTPTVTVTPTSTLSPTATVSPTPTFPLSTLGKPVVAPVPATRGQKVCLYFTHLPAFSDMVIYNSNGEKLTTVSTLEVSNHCWDTGNAAPGVYFVKISVVYADGKKETLWRKAVVIP